MDVRNIIAASVGERGFASMGVKERFASSVVEMEYVSISKFARVAKNVWISCCENTKNSARWSDKRVSFFAHI